QHERRRTVRCSGPEGTGGRFMFACASLTDDTVTWGAVCPCHRPEIQTLTNRINVDLSRRGFVVGTAVSIASLGLPFLTRAQPAVPTPPKPVLFTQVRLFDGKSPALRDGMHLLVEGNRIKAIGTGTPAPPDRAQVIDCGGRVVMPGLIDAHWHSLF